MENKSRKDNNRRRKLVGRLDAAFAYADGASPRKRVNGQVPVDIIIAQQQHRQKSSGCDAFYSFGQFFVIQTTDPSKPQCLEIV